MGAPYPVTDFIGGFGKIASQLGKVGRSADNTVAAAELRKKMKNFTATKSEFTAQLLASPTASDWSQQKRSAMKKRVDSIEEPDKFLNYVAQYELQKRAVAELGLDTPPIFGMSFPIWEKQAKDRRKSTIAETANIAGQSSQVSMMGPQGAAPTDEDIGRSNVENPELAQRLGPADDLPPQEPPSQLIPGAQSTQELTQQVAGSVPDVTGQEIAATGPGSQLQEKEKQLIQQGRTPEMGQDPDQQLLTETKARGGLQSITGANFYVYGKQEQLAGSKKKTSDVDKLLKLMAGGPDEKANIKIQQMAQETGLPTDKDELLDLKGKLENDGIRYQGEIKAAEEQKKLATQKASGAAAPKSPTPKTAGQSEKDLSTVLKRELQAIFPKSVQADTDAFGKTTYRILPNSAAAQVWAVPRYRAALAHMYSPKLAEDSEMPQPTPEDLKAVQAILAQQSGGGGGGAPADNRGGGF